MTTIMTGTNMPTVIMTGTMIEIEIIARVETGIGIAVMIAIITVGGIAIATATGIMTAGSVNTAGGAEMAIMTATMATIAAAPFTTAIPVAIRAGTATPVVD